MTPHITLNIIILLTVAVVLRFPAIPRAIQLWWHDGITTREGEDGTVEHVSTRTGKNVNLVNKTPGRTHLHTFIDGAFAALVALALAFTQLGGL